MKEKCPREEKRGNRRSLKRKKKKEEKVENETKEIGKDKNVRVIESEGVQDIYGGK